MIPGTAGYTMSDIRLHSLHGVLPDTTGHVVCGVHVGYVVCDNNVGV